MEKRSDASHRCIETRGRPITLTVTLSLLWEKYRAAHPDGFGYTWFCGRYRAFKNLMRPSMRQTHAAGEKVFVDFAGDTIDIFDPLTGEARPMKLFVAVMGRIRPVNHAA